jgi:hypothetical protein
MSAMMRMMPRAQLWVSDQLARATAWHNEPQGAWWISCACSNLFLIKLDHLFVATRKVGVIRNGEYLQASIIASSARSSSDSGSPGQLIELIS